MILEYFKDLTHAPFVDAVIVFDHSGRVVQKWASPDFNAKIVEALGLHILQTFAILRLGDPSVKEIVVQWERGEIYARTFSQLTLVVVGKSRLNFILLRLLSNVAIDELNANPRFQKLIKKRAPGQQDVLNKKWLDQIEIEYLQKLSIPIKMATE